MTISVWYTFTPGFRMPLVGIEGGGAHAQRVRSVHIVRPGDLQDVARRLTDNSLHTGPVRRADVSRNFSTSLTGRQ